MKLLRNGFDFNYFYLDRIYRIIRIFSPAARGLSADGRIILTILSILSNYFFKNKNPFLSFFQIIEFFI